MSEQRSAAIVPPKWPPNDRDRHLECPFALDSAFQALIESAEAAGWSGDEIAFALLHLAGANLKARAEDAATQSAIARAQRESWKRYNPRG
ncbi:MAG: hypothetical protein Q8Q62_14985 [Mesorhizobium sp.]|nr:hypothetical protein [Mesorhizobium sp.]